MSRTAPPRAVTPARSSLRAGRVAPLLVGLTLAFAGAGRAATVPDVTETTALPSVTIVQPADVAAEPQPKPVVRRTHHARLETIDTTSLSAPISSTLSERVPAAASLVMQARATTLRPAPLPDQDFDAPGPDSQTLASQQQASLEPSVYGQTQHFSGDGFSTGSNLESNKNNRRRPGGGMSLSIPVP